MIIPPIVLLALKGYFLSILVETPVLLLCLSKRHSVTNRLVAGVWLTACSYPVVSLVIPSLINPAEHWTLYVWVSEIFAPLSECILFWLAFGERKELGRRSFYRDMGAVILANLCSFSVGLVLTNFNLL